MPGQNPASPCWCRKPGIQPGTHLRTAKSYRFVWKDKMGFMLVDAPEGNHKIQLRFETPLENRAGQVLLVLTGLLIGVLVIFRTRLS